MNQEEIRALCKERGFNLIIVGADFDRSMLEQLKALDGVTIMQQVNGRNVELREPRQSRACNNGPRDKFGRLK
jgi:hypothetical protein